MKSPLRLRIIVPLTLFFGVFTVLGAHAQMKIGNHPTTIHPASILELESGNQALRLTQGDTIDVNAVIGTDTHTDKYQAAEGMIMYQEKDSSIYMRTQGSWRKVVSLTDVDSTFWKLQGNAGTDSSTSFLGTTDKNALNIGANNQRYIVIHSNGRIDLLGDSTFVQNNTGFGKSVTVADSLNVNGGALNVTADSVYFGRPLAIHDSIVIKGLESALSTDTSLLVIGSGGIVRKISLDSIGIRAVNGVGGTYLHLRFDSVSAGHAGPWIDSTSESGISTLILNIPDASPSQRGLVSDTTQVFTGAKSFQTTLAVGAADTATSTLQVSGSLGLATNLYTGSDTHYDMTVAANAAYRTIIFNVTTISGGYTVTLPDATKIPGRVYTIKKIGKTDDGQLSNPVVISTSSSQTIDGDTGSFTIYNNFTAVTLQAQGGNWYLLK